MSGIVPQIEKFRPIVREAVQNTFQIMFGTSVSEVTLLEKNLPKMNGILGTISFLETADVSLTFILAFKKETIFNVLSAFYGRDFEDFNDSVFQGVGELTNIIYGHIRTTLNDAGYELKMSRPNVVFEKDLPQQQGHKDFLVLKYEFKGEPFFIYLGIG